MTAVTLDRHWWRRAKCGNKPELSDDFMLCDRMPMSAWSDGSLAKLEAIREEFCWRCPVAIECLRDGMAEPYSIRGGLAVAEREQVMQLDCSCGNPIHPRDMISPKRRYFCTNCVPIQFQSSSKV